MSDIYSWMKVLREADLSKSDATEVISKVSSPRGLLGKFFGRKISANDLLSQWKRDGYPTDIDDFVEFLRSAGISARVIRNTFDKLHIDRDSGSDPRITKLARAIGASGIKSHVISYLKKYKKIEESVWDARLSDSEIRKIFLKLLDTHEVGKPDAVKEYVRNWTEIFNSTGSDDEQIQLASEMIAYMIDRQGDASVEASRPTVSSVIRRSDLPPSVKADLLTSIQTNTLYTGDMSDPAEREAIDTIRMWIAKFQSAAAPVQQYSMASAIVNFLANQSTSDDMKYLRNYVTDVIRASAISDSRKTSIISDIKNRRPYTKALKPVKKKPAKKKTLVQSQYGLKESLSDSQLQSVFESAILLQSIGRVKRCQAVRKDE